MSKKRAPAKPKVTTNHDSDLPAGFLPRLRKRIADYLAKHASLDELGKWFASTTWTSGLSSEDAFEIDCLLADADGGERNTEFPAPAQPSANGDKSESESKVKKHLQCPACWRGYGGKAGRRKWWSPVSAAVRKSCYVCDKCGTIWTAETRIDIDDGGVQHVETKIVEVRKEG